jgi:hypothetical protein
MALKDILTEQVKSKAPTWLEMMQHKLDAEDYEWLLHCLKATNDFSGSYIAAKMTKAGYPVSPTTINLLRKNL